MPGFRPTRVFDREIYKILAWRKAHPDLAKGQPDDDSVYTRLTAKYEGPEPSSPIGECPAATGRYSAPPRHGTV